jgi:hypothetical protein
MSGTTIIRFDQKAADYVWRQLREGSSLSRELLARGTPIRKVWSFMPSGSRDVPVHFEGGQIDDHSGRLSALVAYILEYLNQGPATCAVFENAGSEPDYPWLQHSNVPWFSQENEVYHYLAGPGHSSSAIARLLSTAATDRLVGVLTHCDTALGPRVAPDAIQRLARNASAVIVGAWDGAGELVWEL